MATHAPNDFISSVVFKLQKDSTVSTHAIEKLIRDFYSSERLTRKYHPRSLAEKKIIFGRNASFKTANIKNEIRKSYREDSSAIAAGL